jgi:uronate dehydrogenase
MSGPVLVTGAAGRIGTWLRGGLPERGWAVRSLDVVPLTDVRPGEEHLVADITDLAAMTDAAEGVAAIVHMAGISGESTWPAISHANIEGTYCTLEAARRSGVQRVVLASSNHATGYTPRPDGGLLREEDAPPRPDTYYGVAKVTMEALGSLYVDRYGLDVVCLRIGSAFPEPTTTRQLSTWLSPADTVALVDAALKAPSPGFSVVWGVSDNTRR